MRSMPVVGMQPGAKLVVALVGILVNASVGPFSECGLDEAFGFAVGTWSIGPGEAMLQVQLAAQLGE